MAHKDQKTVQHNQVQIDYFSSRLKPTMVPKSTPYILRHIDELIKFSGIRPGNDILEVGCGMGRYTLPLAESGLKIAGLDLTQFLLDRLEKYNQGKFNIPLYCSDIIDHPVELDNRFDFVIGLFTLHHLNDMEASFHAISKMLKPGGTVVFLEPNAYNPLYYIQIIITPGMTFKGDGGITRMRKRLIFDAMGKAGFTEIQMKRFGFSPPFIYNKPCGTKIDNVLEGAPFLRPILPFQLFKGTKLGQK